MSAIKAIEFPERTFETKAELFTYLKEHKETLIGLKKAKAILSDSIRISDFKSIETVKGHKVEKGFIHAVINTTKYLDSHNDLHLDGIWNKSVNEQQGKIFFVADHDLSLKSIIAYPKHVEMKLENIEWKQLGADFEGSTEALIFKVAKENIRLEQVKDIITEKIEIEHSVRMQYVSIDLAIDTNDKDLSEEKTLFDSTIGLVANKDRAIENGYFWVVSEAKVFKEGSMVVAGGSNDITPMLLSKQEIEPSTDTHKNEPSADTQKAKSDEKNSDDNINIHYFI